MIIASIILSSLALLAGVINIILFLVEKKRTNRRHQAMLDCIRSECNSTIKAAEDYANTAMDDFVESHRNALEELSGKIEEQFKRQQSDIDDLKKGACPDYEKALAAANAVNDFNAGISAIMNFDPIATARARRQNGDKEAG